MARVRGQQPQSHHSSAHTQSHPQPASDDNEAKPNPPPVPPCMGPRRQDASDRKRKRRADSSEPRCKVTSAGVADRKDVPQPRQDKARKDTLHARQNQNVAPGTAWIEYQCPYCHASACSTVRNGTVHATGHCGKQFRVKNGLVVRANTHSCPKCGTEVQSARARGQIQCKHKTPNGKACPTVRWYVK